MTIGQYHWPMTERTFSTWEFLATRRPELNMEHRIRMGTFRNVTIWGLSIENERTRIRHTVRM